MLFLAVATIFHIEVVQFENNIYAYMYTYMVVSLKPRNTERWQARERSNESRPVATNCKEELNAGAQWMGTLHPQNRMIWGCE